MIEEKVDINTKDRKGYAPLHSAIRFCDEDMVELLISRNPDLNIRDCRGATPLHDAAKDGKLAIVKLLIENRSDINAQDNYGKTVLDYAQMFYQWDIAAFLTEKIQNKTNS